MTSEEIEESLKPKCGNCAGSGFTWTGRDDWCAACAGTGLLEIDTLWATDAEYQRLSAKAKELFFNGYKPPYPRS